MAVVAIPIRNTLALHLNYGLDAEMKPIIKRRSFNNIKTGADIEDLFELAHEMGDLMEPTLQMVRQAEDNELELE